MSTINLNPPEEFLKARQLGELIDHWLATKLSKAKTTWESYRDKIRFLREWWEDVGPKLKWRLTKSALQDFEVHLRSVPSKRDGQPLAYKTRHAVIRDTRIMFKWASTTTRTVRNFGEWLPWPDGKTPQRKSATVEQLESLMLSAAQSPTPLRDRALIAFFVGTGCRLGEVSGLMVEDLQLMADGSGTAFVTGKRTKANPSGQRNIAFDAVTGKHLIRYMDTVQITSGPLWLSKKKTFNLKKMAIYAIVRKIVARAGLSKVVRGCHDLRRAFATILSLVYQDLPGWADMIRRQLGHKHYSQTVDYALIEVEDIRLRIITPLSLNHA